MAKKSKLGLTKTQEARIARLKKSPTLMEDIKALATELKVDAKKLHARWYYLTVTVKGRSKARVPANTNGIIAYKIDKGTDLTVRADTVEREEKMRALKPYLLKLKVKKWSVPIQRVEMVAMKKVFGDEDLKNLSFGFTKIKDNATMVRVYRKA